MIYDHVTEKDQLKELLRHDAMVYSGKSRKITDARGNDASWIFYLWNLSLTNYNVLISKCFCETLKEFRSTQLVSYGMTSLPILASCITLSDRYKGLAIRKEREKYGLMNQIEGNGDRSKAVVILDDCVNSGSSLRSAIAILESEGYTVEGAVCLVDLSHGGLSWFEALGYKVRTVFNVWQDLLNTEITFARAKEISIIWAEEESTPDNLTPANAARYAIQHYLQFGVIPKPPRCFDQQYDGSGGVFVSLRDPSANYYRVVRSGFYIINSKDANLFIDVMRAAFKTAANNKAKILDYGIGRLLVGVTLVGKQKLIQPNSLNFLTSGITIQSCQNPEKIGGALPNTQFFTSEIEQYHHARFTNTSLSPYEPHILYSHKITKSIEDGKYWPAFGSSLSNELKLAITRKLNEVGLFATKYVCELLRSIIAGEKLKSLPEPPLPFEIAGVGVSIYHNGLIGCWTSFAQPIVTALTKATNDAWADPRYTIQKKHADLTPENIKVVVSLLHGRQFLGAVSPEVAAKTLRIGVDSLVVNKGGKMGIMLADVPCHYGWTKDKMAYSLLQKTGMSSEDCTWSLYETTSWLRHNNATMKLRNGSIVSRRKKLSRKIILSHVNLIGSYICHQFEESFLPNYALWPAQNKIEKHGNYSRIILALQALHMAGELLLKRKFKNFAVEGLRYCYENIEIKNEITVRIPQLNSSPGFESLFFLTLMKTDQLSMLSETESQFFLERIRSFLHEDGSISAGPPGKKIGVDHDILPGVILLAVAEYSVSSGQDSMLVYIDSHFEWYRRRFRLTHAWGMVWWHLQAWSKIYWIRMDERYKNFVFEIADWVIENQLDINGAYLTDLIKNAPGFHTGCVLEGMADAISLARGTGDENRAKLYEKSWQNGVIFMNTLVIHKNDSYFTRTPENIVGGVRESDSNYFMRIDYSAHYLMALVKGINCGAYQ